MNGKDLGVVVAESSPSHSELPLRGLVARLRICVCVSMCVYVCVGEGRALTDTVFNH